MISWNNISSGKNKNKTVITQVSPVFRRDIWGFPVPISCKEVQGYPVPHIADDLPLLACPPCNGPASTHLLWHTIQVFHSSLLSQILKRTQCLRWQNPLRALSLQQHSPETEAKKDRNPPTQQQETEGIVQDIRDTLPGVDFSWKDIWSVFSMNRTVAGAHPQERTRGTRKCATEVFYLVPCCINSFA